MLRVPAHAHGFCFDQDGAFPRARAFHGFLGGGVHRDHIIAIHDVAGDAVGLGAIRQVLHRNLTLHRRGISPLVIFQNQNKRSFLGRREIQALVKNSRGAAAVTDPGHGHNFLSQVAAGHGHAGHHRNQIAEHGNGRNDMQIFQVTEMAGAILAARRRRIFGHVLGENIARRHALYQQRADIADHGGEPVFLFERIRRAHGNGFLALARIQPAHNLVLAEELDHGVFHGAIQAHVVVQVQILLPG